MPGFEYWIVIVATAVAIILCVVLHFEGLNALGRLRVDRIRDRPRIVFMILCIMLLHILEIWVFGVSYYLVMLLPDTGHLTGLTSQDLFECVYYSATVYTTLGFGDIVPAGHVRFMTGTEAVAGLTLIAWSASSSKPASSRGLTE